MSYYILSYRTNGKKEWFGPYQAYELENAWNSDLDFEKADSVEEVAELLAQRIHAEPDAEYLNLVYRNTGELFNTLPAPKTGAASIHCLFDPDAEAARCELELQGRVYVRLVALAVEAATAAESQRMREEEEKRQQEKAELEARDRREYERLRLKYKETE